MKNRTMMFVTMLVSSLAARAGQVVFTLDLSPSPRTPAANETITYDPAWSGGPSVTLALDGATIGTYSAAGTRTLDTRGWSAGLHTLTHTAGGETLTAEYLVTKDISSAALAFPAGNFTYTGSEVRPTVTVTCDGKTLTAGTDYTVAYANNVNAGTASVTVTGKGNYTGTATETFTIGRKSIAASNMTLGTTSYTYDGAAKTPAVTVKDGTKTLTSGTDYTVAYANNIAAGTAVATLTGIGNYSGSVEMTYRINSLNLNDSTVTLSISPSEYVYDGTEKKPSTTLRTPVSTLVEGSDYEVVYTDNINAGTGRATVVGKGSCTGSRYTTFRIARKSITSVTLEATYYTYDNTAKTPGVTVVAGDKTLTEDLDYTVSYADNVNVGTASVVVDGVGNYTGHIVRTFDIQLKIYNVRFNANGGAGAMANQQFTYGQAAALSPNAFMRAGYTFKGWATSATATSAAYADKASVNNLTSTANDTVDLYAVWEANTYSVKFNANGGTGTMSNESFTYGTAKALTQNAYTRTGYAFQGWATTAAATSAAYADKASVSNLTATANGTVNLYAVWKANTYSVTFNANGGTGTMSDESFTYGTAKALTQNAYTRTGYSFQGWAASAAATSAAYADKASVSNLTATANGTVNLYAVWQVNTYSVKFNANGGTGTMSDESFTYGTAKALTQNAYTRTGYAFQGWAATAAATSASYADKASVSNLTATANGTVNLYAVWQIVSYPITYLETKGAANPNPATYTVTNGVTFAALPDVPDWTFAGWDPGSIAAGSTGARTVTALWTPASGPETLQEAVFGESGSVAVGGADDAVSFTEDGFTIDGTTMGDGAFATVTITTEGRGTMSFDWTVSSEAGADEGWWTLDGVEMGRMSGKKNSLVSVTNTVATAGTHVWTFTYSKDESDAGGTDTMTVTNMVWSTIPEVVVTGGTGSGEYAVGTTVTVCADPAPYGTWFDHWEGDTDLLADATARQTTLVMPSAAVALTAVFKDELSGAGLSDVLQEAFALGEGTAGVQGTAGAVSLTNGVIAVDGPVMGDGATAGFSVQTTGPGEFSFRWAVSSEADVDEATFAKDGTVLSTRSGKKISWEAVTNVVADAGTHTWSFAYTKDEADSSGQDSMWVADIRWTPASAPARTATSTTPEPVPYAWLVAKGRAASTASEAAYEAAAHATAANGRAVWECYVAGLDPADADDDLVARIAMDADGAPVITWTPDWSAAEGDARRVYTVEGKATLDGTWGAVDANSRFFRVKAGLVK